MSFTQEQKKIWAQVKHGKWFKNKSKLELELAHKAQSPKAQIGNKYSPFVMDIIALGDKHILSSDKKPTNLTEEEIKLLKESKDKNKIHVYFADEWFTFFNLLANVVLKHRPYLVNVDMEDKDCELFHILLKMCSLEQNYTDLTIEFKLKKYNLYMNRKNHTYLPLIISIPPTPPGKSTPNYIVHIKSSIEPKIKGESLLHLFPGSKETGVDSSVLIDLLNTLPTTDKIEISKNLKGWVKTNPDHTLSVMLLKSGKIPYYSSFCICKKCKYLVSDSEIDKFLESPLLMASLRRKDDSNIILKQKPANKILDIAKNFLYIACPSPSCSEYISASSIIPKYLGVFKDVKVKEFIYKIFVNLAEKCLLSQFPELSCCVCLTDKLTFDSMFQNQECKHLPCICLECNDAKINKGLPQKGQFYVNSDYQCLACTAFEPTGNPSIDTFNKNGGVQQGYVGRFCMECVKPFQQKPETCGVEQGNTDIPEYCIDCIIRLAEYNKKIRLTVTCPNLKCNTPISRYDGCDVVECPQCNTQFCYGCEYIFVEPPTFEWNWTCSCIIDHYYYYSGPKQYNDKSHSVCEDRYIEYQSRRGISIPRLQLRLLPQEPELPVPELVIPVPEVVLPVPEAEIEHTNINIFNISVANPLLQERVNDEDDIQRQILLSMQYEDESDFINLL